jgi:dipeptidase E
MKMLLTSNGLSNQSITDELFRLVGKAPSETHIAFIPTAVNITEGSKEWFVDDLMNIKRQSVAFIDIVDISAVPKSVWLPKLEAADVLCFSGGSTRYLGSCIEQSGLKELLPDLLETRVWMGISAGSVVTGPTLRFSSQKKKEGDKEILGAQVTPGLGLVDFYIRPHLNAPGAPHAAEAFIREQASEVREIVYALDNMSALSVQGGEVRVVSEGHYLVLNQH